jgi:Sec-independent protein translocase protein TatA
MIKFPFFKKKEEKKNLFACPKCGTIPREFGSWFGEFHKEMGESSELFEENRKEEFQKEVKTRIERIKEMLKLDIKCFNCGTVYNPFEGSKEEIKKDLDEISVEIDKLIEQGIPIIEFSVQDLGKSKKGYSVTLSKKSGNLSMTFSNKEELIDWLKKQKTN